MPRLYKIITKTLSLRLSLIMVSAIALLLIAALGVMFFFSRQALKEEVISDAEETLKGKARQIDNILLSVEQSAGNVYWELIHHLDQSDQMAFYCRELIECNPYIFGAAIAFDPHYYPNRESFMTYVHRKDYSLTADEKTELVTQNQFANRSYTEQIWYTGAMETGSANWTEPMKNDDTEEAAIIAFGLPIFGQDGKSVGVLAVSIAIEQLSKTVLADELSNGYITLLARDGSFIIHPDLEKLSHQTIFTQLEQGNYPSVREAAEAMVSGKEGFKPFLMNDRVNYVLFQPFQREMVAGRVMEDLGWSIGVVYPDEVIFHEYNQLLYYLIAIAVIGLLLFFFLCRMIAHRELLPLRLLTQSAQRIAEGNYRETIPDTKREDEIGQLQAHFQKMQQALEGHIDEQEQLSAQLQERGEVLQKAYSEARKAEQMKMAFLHFMTNQMLEPAENIEKSVLEICHQCNRGPEELGRLADTVWQQGEALIEVLNRLIKEAEDSSQQKQTMREGAYE